MLRQGLASDALLRQQEVLGIALVMRDPARHASALNNLALITERFESLPRAIGMLQQAVALGRKYAPQDPRLTEYERHLAEFEIKQTKLELQKLHAMASSMLNAGDYQGAHALFLETAKRSRAAGLAYAECLNLNNAAVACLRAGATETGLEILKHAEEIIPQLDEGREQLQMMLEANRRALIQNAKSSPIVQSIAEANAHAKRGDFRSAEESGRKAFDLASEAFGQDHYLAALGLDTIGVFLFHQGNASEALGYLQRAQQVALEWESKRSIIELVDGHLKFCQEYLNGHTDEYE